VRTAFAVLLVALLPSLAGCGGGGSREGFVNEAGEICRTSNQRVQALGTPESFTDTLLYARRAEDAVRDELEELRDLNPPAEVEDDFEAYLATLEERRQQLELLADAADRNNMADIQGIGSELETLTAKARTQARRAGLTTCE
jgi:hypothetical protein